MNQQELIYKLSMFEQQANQLQQQMQLIEEGILELKSLNLGLDELVGSKNKEILSPIGRGIFVKTQLLSEELIVDIGGKRFVKKSVPQTKKLIEEQIEKLKDVKVQLNVSLENMNKELEVMMNGLEDGKEEEHEHSDKCMHEKR